MNIPEEYDWSESLDCAVTLCDNEGTVLYQNARSRQVNGDVRGRSLIPCHNERSRGIIARLLAEGGKNVYTIEKRGVRKLIYQTVWRRAGEVCRAGRVLDGDSRRNAPLRAELTPPLLRLHPHGISSRSKKFRNIVV